MRQMMVAGNWKMHGSVAFTRDMIQTLTTTVTVNEAVALVLCPPMLYLTQAIQATSDTALCIGAQNCAQVQTIGAYTGEISATMLADVGCEYVIVGHSERRALYGETDKVVADKTQAALLAGLKPIVCVGETLAEREAGQAERVIATQLDAISQVIGASGWSKAIIAYEPIWAIGTGKTATPEEAQYIHAFIRQHLTKLNINVANSMTILYGGSVKPDNAAAIFSKPDVDGGLIGGASLNSDDFAKIYAAAVSH
jgi:triosephosphate isomerase (TIM)